MEQVEHTHIDTRVHSWLVILTQSMSQFPVHPSITQSLCLVHWGFNYRTTEEPHYTEREGTERERNERDIEIETERGGRDQQRENLNPLQLKY